MNFRLILIVSLGIIVFASACIYGYIFLQTYSSTTSGKDIYAANKVIYFLNAGLLVVALLLNGLVFLKS